ncbi:antifreeze protein [Fragilariopsis cylindrus CCMP1102]|uniref:Antifreeze protein n=1 Tax=Fragilariopsis cylindrus CCMP1102 TaxID=635003 RepID=A0A1E7EJA7_9STRA|nr:antifreeze protein [Fragilariopsis cylindrus CCMP1102]|eukprot:OEU05977.1 antifreeze protein [Fragilariopsis cylindrus CCMP1102]
MMKLNLFILSATAMVNAVVSGAPIDPIDLGTAGDFAILSKSGISTVPDSVITGDIGVSPIAATAITGFTLTMDSSTEFSTSGQVSGHAMAADYTSPTSTKLTTAVSDMETAYTDAAGRGTSLSTPLVNYLNPGAGEIGGETLKPGVYTFDRDVTISNGAVTFDGLSTDIFIIQTSKSVKQAADTSVTLTGGALAKNIFWSVAEEFIMEDKAHMEGVLLVKTAVTMKTGSTMNGRVLAQTAVVLQVATVAQPSA